jgi:hypothetical protein
VVEADGSLTYETSFDSRASSEKTDSGIRLASSQVPEQANVLTFFHVGIGQEALLEHSQVHRCAVSDLIINIIQTPRRVRQIRENGTHDVHSPIQQGVDALLQPDVVRVQAKLSQAPDSRGPNSSVLQHDPVVNEPDILGRLWRLGALDTQQVQDPDRQFGKFAILDEFAKMRERLFLASGDVFDHLKDGLHNRTLEIVPSFVTEDAGEEGEHRRMLFWEFEAERSDSINNDDLELVADVTHESADLFHQPVDGSFVASLFVRKLPRYAFAAQRTDLE